MNVSLTEDASASFVRYGTSSGLTVVTAGEVLSVFQPGENTLIWWDANGLTSPQNQWISSLELVPTKLQMVSFVNQAFPESWNYFEQSSAVPACVNDSLLTGFDDACPTFVLNSISVDLSKRAAQVFCPREIRVIEYRASLNGKLWLVPSYIQDSAEAAAKDHAVHYEDVILSREHSGFDGLRLVMQKVRRSCSECLKSFFGGLLISRTRSSWSLRTHSSAAFGLPLSFS